MPRYDYKCNACRTITEITQSIKDEPLAVCDVCDGPINRSYDEVFIAPSSMPTRNEAADIEKQTNIMHRDVAAYKRLRKDGVQPKSVKGAAELENRAASRWEVETGQNLGGNAKLGRQFDEVQTAIKKGETL